MTAKADRPSRKLRPLAVAFHRAGFERIINTLERAKVQGIEPRTSGEPQRLSLNSTPTEVSPTQKR